VSTGEANRTELRDCAGSISGLQFAPDGKTIASSNYLYAVAPDGSTILWDKCIGTVQWWEPITGKELRRLKGTVVAGSADGKWLAIRQGTGVLLWDMAAGKEARRLPLEDAGSPSQEKEHFVGSFSADGSTLVVPDGGTIRILDTKTGKERHAFAGHSDDVVLVGFSPDGRRLISAGDCSVRFWDPRTGKELGSFRGPTHSIHAASLSADGRTLAAGTRGGAIHVWDLEAGKELRKVALEQPVRPVLALAPDGKTLVFKCPGGAPGIHVVEVATGKEVRCFGHGNQCDALAFLYDGSAVADLTTSIELFDSQSGNQLLTLVELNNGGSRDAGMAFSPDGRMVVTGYPDRKGNPMDTVSLWEMASGKFVSQFRGHDGHVSAFAFAHTGKVVASGGWDGTVRLWDVASGRELHKFEGHRGGVLSLAFSPDDKLLASGGSDTSILVWDVAELTANRPLPEVRLARADLEKLWTELGAESAAVAYKALWQLAAGGKPVAAFLKQQMYSEPAEEKRVKKLIADLDAEQFDLRDRASAELAILGPKVETWLRETLERPPSAEVRQRLEKLLAKLQNPGQGRAAEGLRQLRAVQSLEYAGTPDARRLLQTLAAEPDTPRGREAKASLQRLEKQKP
jgi:WD40 repeat protein